MFFLALRFLGLSKIAASAGLKVNALKADKQTDIAMVMANCWYKRPVMPPVNATGINTADKIKAMATTGPATSFMALLVASLGESPCSI